jgi:hypothetical protein
MKQLFGFAKRCSFCLPVRVSLNCYGPPFEERLEQCQLAEGHRSAHLFGDAA